MSQERPFAPLPAPGDIVYCQFPEKLGSPGLKPRPVLVISQREADDGTLALEVAYGTSQKTKQLYAGEFLIASVDVHAFDLAGLSFDTKFDLAHTQVLPYTTKWFKVPPNPRFGQSPKLGSLHPSLLRTAQAAYNAGQTKKPK